MALRMSLFLIRESAMTRDHIRQEGFHPSLVKIAAVKIKPRMDSIHPSASDGFLTRVGSLD